MVDQNSRFVSVPYFAFGRSAITPKWTTVRTPRSRGKSTVLGELIWVNLLGPLEVSHALGTDDTRLPVRITATKLRQVLALLAVNAGSTVSVERVIDELWPDGPPNTVKTIVLTYVHQLRKLFDKNFHSARGA
jgi:hypothetical protein